MALVYKAFRDENDNVVFVCFTDKVSVDERISFLSGNKVPRVGQVCFIRSGRSDIEIPKGYKVASVGGNIKEATSSCSIEKLIKDMEPSKLMEPEVLYEDILTMDIGNWIMQGDTPLCTFQKPENEGVWLRTDNIIQYREETQVKVMRDAYLRHKPDKEYIDLSINLDTGLCLYSYKKFNNNCSLEKKSKFNLQCRCWETLSRDFNDDIISVKRS